MMKIENRTVGQLNLFLVGLAFAYYTAWIIGLPFVEEDYLPMVKPFFPLGPGMATLHTIFLFFSW